MIKFTCVVLIASATTLLGELPSSGVNAQTITIKQYQHPKNENDLTFNKAYLAGLKDGLVAYNNSLEDKLFCISGMPPLLTFEQASDAVMHWTRKHGVDPESLSLGLALLYGLKETFPCRASPR